MYYQYYSVNDMQHLTIACNDHYSEANPQSNKSNKSHKSHNHNKSHKSHKSHNHSKSRKGSTDQTLVKFKTEVCKYWQNQVDCPYGNKCNFAHGDVEKRNKDSLPSRYKTRLCQKFNEEGFCLYGTRCQFIHFKQKTPKVQYSTLLDCLIKEPAKYFDFFNQKMMNFGQLQRLDFFSSLQKPLCLQVCIQDITDVDQCDQNENHVTIRPRHESF